VLSREPVGTGEVAARQQFDKARKKTALLCDCETAHHTHGHSPHPPYSFSPPLLLMLARFALDEGLPVMMHAAESRAEELLMLYGKGPFAEGFASRGFTFRSPGVSTVRHLAETGVLQARPLLAHCVRVDDEDIRLIKEHGASV